MIFGTAINGVGPIVFLFEGNLIPILVYYLSYLATTNLLSLKISGLFRYSQTAKVIFGVANQLFFCSALPTNFNSCLFYELTNLIACEFKSASEIDFVKVNKTILQCTTTGTGPHMSKLSIYASRLDGKIRWSFHLEIVYSQI